MKALRAWLKASGLNQSQFAALMDTDRYQVSRWLRGRKRPNLDTLRKIQKATRIPLEDLAKGL